MRVCMSVLVCVVERTCVCMSVDASYDAEEDTCVI
jgi:hypothetical protein